MTGEDIDRVMGELAAEGIVASTRRGYVQAFKGFHASWWPASQRRCRKTGGHDGAGQVPKSR